jgi:hypothetical protein
MSRRRQQTVSEIPERALDIPGVWTTARWEGKVRNTRGPTRHAFRRAETVRIRDRPKSRGAGRESEGLIVPVKAVRSRWREGALLW